MTRDDHETTTLIFTRCIAAPREEVFRAWTAPEMLARWWWPARFQTTYEVDLRPGGHWQFRSVDLPDFGTLSVGGTFQEVRAPERLIYTWAWEGQEASQTLVTVEFRELGTQTEVLLRHEGFADERVRDDHGQGWSDCVARLEELAKAGGPGEPGSVVP